MVAMGVAAPIVIHEVSEEIFRVGSEVGIVNQALKSSYFVL